jgi:probable FeS assembly SUF system protein SufT
MKAHEPITLTRDCEAIQIPSGSKMVLPAGTVVMITQSLGDTYTVTTDHGYMVRIAGKDADAMGLERSAGPAAAAASPQGPEDLEQMVWDQLRTCYDPEIPVNVVDLGLVYSCEVSALPEGGSRVTIQMTLTAPGCGMGPVIADDVKRKVEEIAGVREAQVEVVFDPQWNQNMMTEAARLQLGLF